MSKHLCILVSFISLFIATIKCDFFTVPSSQVLYEGDRTTLICHVEGSAFWRLNGTIYSELNAAFFESRGITSFDFFIGNSELNKTLTIVGSVLNNNTVIHCISVQDNGITNTSDSATITVLGLPSNVTLHELNSTSVKITWSESFVPPTVTLERYSITVFNTSEPNNHHQVDTVTDSNQPTSDGLYSQIFNFDQELTPCTQITFSVTSTSSIGTSPPSNVSWEMPLYIGRDGSEFKDSLSCFGSLDSKTLTLSFKPHKLCAFQKAKYNVSITKNGRSIASTSGSFNGSQQQETIQHPFADQNVREEHTAHVSVTSQYGNEQASVKCYMKESPSVPPIGGLNGDRGSESGGFSVGFVAGIVISSIVVLLAVIVIIGVVIYSIRNHPVDTKSKHKHNVPLNELSSSP